MKMIHLTLLALAELAPAARWWPGIARERAAVAGRHACDWVADNSNAVNLDDLLKGPAQRDARPCFLS